MLMEMDETTKLVDEVVAQGGSWELQIKNRLRADNRQELEPHEASRQKR